VQRVFIKGIKGGTGSTSVVANLACALKKADVDVIAIDLDAKSDLSLHFGLPWDNTFGWSNADNFAAALSYFYQDDDGVVFLPYGTMSKHENDIINVINNCQQLDCKATTWLLFDCPAHLDLASIPLQPNDIVLELINCDAVCHSLIYKRLLNLKGASSCWKHYFLINKYNSASTLEFDLFSLWQSTLPLMASFFINHDEAIKESTAARNVAVNCAPLSIANDDFETLVGWLMSKAALTP
jgi:cellulose synthase operon protein YhjQ